MYSGESFSFSERVAGMIQRGAYFESARPVCIARAPGRLDLMGGNVDYTGGLVLQFPLSQAVRAAVQPTARRVIRVLNPGAAAFGWKTELELPLDMISSLPAIESLCGPGTGTFWGRYVLGGFHLLHQRYGACASLGANVFLDSDLPPNRGLASSAALEVAVLKAASGALGIALAGVSLAQAAQWVENHVARSACGIMDQGAIVLGRRNCLIPLLCQPCLPLPPIRLPGQVRVWGIDSMVPRATNSAPYELARAAAFMGYKMICRWQAVHPAFDKEAEIPRWTDTRLNGYLSNLSPSEFRSTFEHRLPESLSGEEFLSSFGEHVDPFTAIDPHAVYPVRAAVRYATEENLRIRTAKLLFENMRPENLEDSLRLIGELQFQSHFAYTGCGLGAGACDDLVELARRFGLFGAKMTGGGAGGVVAVMGLDRQQDAIHQIVGHYAAARGAVPDVFEGSSDGADLSGTQVTGMAAVAGSL